MKFVKPITRSPGKAQVGQGEKYPFAEDLFEIMIPLFTNKHPQNPLPGGGTGGGDGGGGA